MRILVVSNLYPPYYVGGYELGCRDVVEGLKACGHEVKVLTSTYGEGKADDDGDIYRWLQADLKWKKNEASSFLKVLQKERNNQGDFKRLCDVFCPDVVYIWNLTHISISIAFIAQRLEVPLCYFVFDNWLLSWENDYWYSLWNRQSSGYMNKLGKALLRRLLGYLGLLPFSLSLDLNHVQFASHYLKKSASQAGRYLPGAKVIHAGIDAGQYPYKKVTHSPRRLLYVGQIVSHKGVETAIRAVETLVHQHGPQSVTLTIVGGSIIPSYESHVRDLVSSLGLEDNISFTGTMPRESLPAVYQEHDILIFPSTWEEPFGLTLLEAMSSGLAIVGTGTGGSGEILQDGVNALLFPKEDAIACASQILSLLADPELFETIRQNGRRTVEQKFRFESMMEKIESSLHEAVD